LFLAVLEVVSRREEIRVQEAEQTDIISKQAEPGKFKDERKWNDWDTGIVNYQSTIHGAQGVPLSYVIREL